MTDEAILASILGDDIAREVASTTKNLVEAHVETLPDCDIHKAFNQGPTKALYDAYLPNFGQWGNVCEEHFKACGCSLGTGRGQKLVVAPPKPSASPLTVGAVLAHKASP